MNTKTAAIALGVAGILLVAGLATLLSSESLSELLNDSKGTNEGSSNNGPGDNDRDTGPSNLDDGGDDQTTDPVDPVIPTVKEPVAEPAPVQGEPKLNIAYLSGTYGNDVYYGMPSVRSGPYPGWENQYPGANEFRIETNGYGPDQPDGPTKIALFIQVDGIGPRWVGDTEIPEGTVEVRTFPENAYTPRLVNLFDDGSGNSMGILVNSWSVFDYSFVYEPGVTDRNLMTFSLDITKLGDYKVSVWAIHDHGNGHAVQVSNMVSWTVHVKGDWICSNNIDPYSYSYVNGTEYAFTAKVQRGTEPDDDNHNVFNTIAYTGTVRNYLWIEGTSGYEVKINGVRQTGTIVNGGLRFDLGTFDFGDTPSKAYSFTITPTDGKSHRIEVETYDMATNSLVGQGNAYLWGPWW